MPSESTNASARFACVVAADAPPAPAINRIDNAAAATNKCFTFTPSPCHPSYHASLFAFSCGGRVARCMLLMPLPLLAAAEANVIKDTLDKPPEAPWQWVREDRDNWRVEEKKLQIKAQRGTLWKADRN